MIGSTAHAQSYFDLGNLSTSGTTSFTIGAWTLVFNNINSSTTNTARGCYLSGGGLCSDVTIQASVHRGELDLTFFHDANNNHVADGNLLTGSSGSGDRNAYFNFTVADSANSNGYKLVQVSNAVVATNGTSNGTNVVDPSGNVNATEYLCTYSSSPCSSGSAFSTIMVDSAAHNPNLVNVATANQSYHLSVNKNLFSTGSSLNIYTMTQRYVSNPEPVSIGVFSVGLAGAAVARWRSRRSQPKAI